MNCFYCLDDNNLRIKRIPFVSLLLFINQTKRDKETSFCFFSTGFQGSTDGRCIGAGASGGTVGYFQTPDANKTDGSKVDN